MGSLDLQQLRTAVDEAKSLNDNGRPGEARSGFERLSRTIEDSGDGRPEVLELHSRTLLGLGCCLLELEADIDAALHLLGRAEELAEAAKARHMQVAIGGQRALLHLRQGRIDAALREFDVAVALKNHAEPHDLMTLLLNRGVLQLELGSLDVARSDFTEAARLAAAEADRSTEQMLRHNLAYVEFLAGNMPAALEGMAAAAAIGALDDGGIALLDRARVLREAGLVRDAGATLAEAAELFEARGLWQDLAETELVLAECALTDRDVARARAFVDTARQRFQERHNELWLRKAQLLSLSVERAELRHGQAEASAARWARTAAAAAKLAALCATEDRPELARSARLVEADCRLTAGLPPPDDVDLEVHAGDPLTIRMHVYTVRTRRALAEGDVRAAGRTVRRGLQELTSAQSRFGSLDLRTASAVHAVALAELDLDRALRTGRPAPVLESLERFRAASIGLTAVRPPTDDVTARLLADLRQNAEAQRALVGDPGSQAEVQRLRKEAATLEQAVRARAWELSGDQTPVRSHVAAAMVRAAVREDGSAYACFASHRGRLLAVTVVNGRARMRDLADAVVVEQEVRRIRADLEALARPGIPAQMRDVVRTSLTAALRRMDDLLVAPLNVSGLPLVVSPSGLLAVLPWNLLPSRRGLPAVVVPSAASWLKGRERRGAVRREVAVVAGPGLALAGDEARRVRAMWPGASLLEGATATTDAVGRALGDAAVVHIAAHGTHEQESPLFSCLQLADGPIYAYELDPSRGMADCVVLSACEAGLSTVRPGDEGLGLTSVLLHHGARSVVAGVATVRDDVAAEVMERVHRRLSRGADSASAVALAVADCAEAEAPAPFVTFGGTWRSGTNYAKR